MDFYTYHYLQVHQQAFTLVGYGITIAASLLVLYYSWRYFRHRFVVRHPLPGFKRNSSINSVNPGGGPSRASTG